MDHRPPLLKLYTSVIEDVISGVREAFLDEGVDEQVLQELKQIWESKLMTSKALEQPDPQEPQPPLINSQKATANIPNKPMNSMSHATNSHPQIAVTDLNKPVPIQITLPAQLGSSNTQPRTLTIQVPASALHGNQLHSVLTGPVISATMALPTHVAEAVLQSHVTANLQGQAMSGSLQLQQQQHQQQQHQQQQPQQQQQQQVLQAAGLTQDNRQPFTHHQLQNSVPQLDGQHDTSDEEEEDEEEEDEDNEEDDKDEDKDEEENDENEAGAEEEPLNSEDDVSEEDPTDMFDTDNVVVCQYDKVLNDSQATPLQSKWHQYIAGLAASLSLVAAGAWFFWPTPLLPRLLGPESPVPMTTEEASWMVSTIEIGTLFSPLPATLFSDRYGRKFTLLLTVPLFFINLCLIVYIRTVESLYVARFIQGVSLGIPYTVLPLYLGEIASVEARGTVTSFFYIAWGVGGLFPFCCGPFLSYEALSYVTFALNLIFLLSFFWQPDSPYYYAMRGNVSETTKTLKLLRGFSTADSIEIELREIQLEVKKAKEEKLIWNDVIATPEDRRGLLLIFIVGVVSFLSGQNAILSYTTETFSKFQNNFIPPDVLTIVIGLVSLVGSIISLFTSDRFGRRFLLLTSSLGCMFSLFIASTYFYLYTKTAIDLSSYSWVAPLAIIMYNLFITSGMNPVCVTYTAELFPTKTRGIASSISSINLTICSFLVLKSYETIKSAIGIYFIYLCYTIVCLIGTILFYFMMPETKGKTFLEIREILSKS